MKICLTVLHSQMSDELSLSFIAGEILGAGTDIEIRTRRPFDPDVARSAVVLQQKDLNVAAPVTVDEKGEIIRISTKDLRPGKYQLRIHELLDTKGEEILNHALIPFGIGALAGKVPGELRVEHATHVAIGKISLRRLEPGERAPPDFKYVEFVKAVHRQKGEQVHLAFDEKGEQVDGQAMLDDYQLRRYAKFGRLHETLFNHLEGGRDSDQVDVAVWPHIKEDLTNYKKPNHGEIKEPPQEARDLLKEAIRTRSAVVDKLKKLGAKVKDTPQETLVIYASLRADKVRDLAKSDDVSRIFLDDRTAIRDLADSEAISRVKQAHALGFIGLGVHVAVFEDGPSDVSNLVFADRYLQNPPDSTHARLTSAIIKNVEPGKPHGYAPGCHLYSANIRDNAALQWALDQPRSCTVISQSFHRSSSEGQNEQGSPSMSADDILKDHMVTQWPYPTIVHAAGNISEAVEYVNHKGFNTLSVGSHDDNATAMAGSSVFKNPTSPHGDRELPELAANGTGVTALGLAMSGTSFAAPAVAGTAAVIQSIDSTLKSWPEACRAILLASADRNISGGTWALDLGLHIDQSDGAGALNSYMASSIAQQRRDKDASPAPRGWDVDSLVTEDLQSGNNLSKFRYRVQVPPPSEPGPIRFVYTIKAALAWNSKVAANSAGVLTSAPTVNLDLIVRDISGLQVSVSSSFDNSYEVVEFTAVAGGSYDIFIRRASGTALIWYALAWNVTTRLFTLPPLIAGLE